MYLVTITRLRLDGQPVPLSQLAEILSISPVSVNEMCRKLQDQKLAVYQPYKGVSLTPEGEQRAYYILRCHRLWEVFLVEKLAFLEYPSVNPEGEPIPRDDGVLPASSTFPLVVLSVGQPCHVIRCDANQAGCAFLDEHGIRPGASLTVQAMADDSLLVQVGEMQISLARTLAESITVEPEDVERLPQVASNQ